MLSDYEQNNCDVGDSGFAPLYETTKGEPATVAEVACWAHVRRKFNDIHVASNAPIAEPPFAILMT